MKAWKRITISALLFLTFCAAGFFTGFRYGLSDGVDAQVDARLADRQAQRYVIIFDVSALAAAKTRQPFDLAALAQDIKGQVSRRSWDDAGGPCAISPMPPNRLVISASDRVHDQVSAYLAGRRDGSADRSDATVAAAAQLPDQP